MKYKIGDKVRIKKGLKFGEYGNDSYTSTMDKMVKKYDYILTVSECLPYKTAYKMEKCGAYHWTEEMIEGLADLTDREKFEGWIRKLSSLDFYDPVWDAFNFTVTSEPNEKGYEDKLKVVSDYLFGAKKKKMTKAEIEAKLGYEIEIVE